jgi:hypothetical protein
MTWGWVNVIPKNTPQDFEGFPTNEGFPPSNGGLMTEV